MPLELLPPQPQLRAPLQQLLQRVLPQEPQLQEPQLQEPQLQGPQLQGPQQQELPQPALQVLLLLQLHWRTPHQLPVLPQRPLLLLALPQPQVPMALPP